jgi:transposase InsO family protein
MTKRTRRMESGGGDGHHLHRDGARFCVSGSGGGWFSRRVLAWKLSITLEVGFCIEAVEEVLARYRRPEIFNTDQGSQFTSGDFTGLLREHKIAVSMDGKAAWRDTCSSNGSGVR